MLKTLKNANIVTHLAKSSHMSRTRELIEAHMRTAMFTSAFVHTRTCMHACMHEQALSRTEKRRLTHFQRFVGWEGVGHEPEYHRPSATSLWNHNTHSFQ